MGDAARLGEALEVQVRQLSAQLQEALRAGKRQAAPFAKGPPKDKPKRPGRKGGAGYGPKAHRPIPEAEPDEVIDVPRPEVCPDCGGELREVKKKDGTGSFVGCGNYRDGCKFTSDVEKAPRAGGDDAAYDDEGFPTTGAACAQWMETVLLIPADELTAMRARGAMAAWDAEPEDYRDLAPDQWGVLARAIGEIVGEDDPFKEGGD